MHQSSRERPSGFVNARHLVVKVGQFSSNLIFVRSDKTKAEISHAANIALDITYSTLEKFMHDASAMNRMTPLTNGTGVHNLLETFSAAWSHFDQAHLELVPAAPLECNMVLGRQREEQKRRGKSDTKTRWCLRNVHQMMPCDCASLGVPGGRIILRLRAMFKHHNTWKKGTCYKLTWVLLCSNCAIRPPPPKRKRKQKRPRTGHERSATLPHLQKYKKSSWMYQIAWGLLRLPFFFFLHEHPRKKKRPPNDESKWFLLFFLPCLPNSVHTPQECRELEGVCGTMAIVNQLRRCNTVNAEPDWEHLRLPNAQWTQCIARLLPISEHE